MKQNLLLFVLLLSLIKGAAAPCGEADIKISYGPCVNDNRDIVFYVTAGCNDAPPFFLPPPIRGKPCDFACPAGSFYNLSNPDTGGQCTNCPAGYEADGFAVVYNNLTANNIAPFVSNCNGTSCKNWTVWGNHSYLTAGFQNSNSYINLSLTVNIFQTAGEVLFEYTCPETRYDSSQLRFYIDGHRMNENYYISDVWKKDNFSLPFGQHNLTWEYYTSYYYNPSEMGARLRNIEIRGTKYLVTACKPCLSGSTSTGGDQCTPCKFNSIPKNGTCSKCPPDQYALPGDTECHERKTCQTADYYTEYDDCVNGKRLRTFHLYQPSICEEVTIPQNDSIDCPLCDPGMYKLNGRCTACPTGTYRHDGADNECKICPAGTFTTKNDYDKRPEIEEDRTFSTGCESDNRDIDNCATAGWFEQENVITPGRHFGPVTVWLKKTVTATEYGNLFFAYTTTLRNDSYFKFYSSYYSYLMTNSSENGHHNFTAPFYSGETTFNWILIKTCANYECTHSESDSVVIEELSVSTESQSGGTECSPCYNGTSSGEGATECVDCQPGTYAGVGSPECLACPAGQYSSQPRSTNCSVCLNNTFPNEAKSECAFANCGFDHNSTFSFSLATLQTNDYLLNASTPNSETRLFYLDICTLAHSNETCKDYYDPEPDGGDITYACTISTTSEYFYSYRLGVVAEMNYLEIQDAPDAPPRYGVNLTYSQGDSQYCSHINNYIRNSIEIDFICVPDSGAGEPVPGVPFQFDDCRYHYEWITEYACRICKESDYEHLESECVKGKRNSTWVLLQADVACAHGFSPAHVWEITKCPNPLVKLSAGGIVGIVLGAIALLGLSVFFIVYYIRKNRALRYQLFQKGNFSLQVERSDDEGGGSGAGGDYAPSTSMFGGGGAPEEQYKSVDFSGMSANPNTDNTY